MAFSENTVLASVTFGNSVTTIGESAFFRCRALRSVVIPNTVTTIGDNAFADCRALRSVTIGSAVVTIGNNTFLSCTALNEVINLATTPQVLQNDFGKVNLSAATLRVPAASLEAYKTAKVWSDFGNIVAIAGSEVANDDSKVANDTKADNVLTETVTEAKEPKTIKRDFIKPGNHTLVFNEGFPATVEVSVVGAGGGGQGGHSKAYQQGMGQRTERGVGGGGGGGAAVIAKFEVTSSTTFNITVGEGGAGGTGKSKPVGGSWESGSPGKDGGSSSVSYGRSTISAEGGKGGGGSGAQNVTGAKGGQPG